MGFADGCTMVGLDSTVVIDRRAGRVDLDQVFAVSPGRGSVLGRRDSSDGVSSFVLLDLMRNKSSSCHEAFQLFATF